ncbi:MULTISPECIES: nitroreductase family protein [unclassified Clostridioides]|uniref:nitroreductase family protein n=1 Tax=unclassified Clostridioides TaxID=2635829 RepID=UPI001D0F5F46|nr:nitroreductase family protein [Clostridioides sp. ZZV14-6150]MCC0659865.1 nitroreductase family protein [Clostridioides sp. ZZV14-6154]MCC0666620.1 nitroreductase family protein [Clostridioides sp. ZZV14-6153]MCC0717642.1 nitroreductase family protein [Clostridioides sp. ZZV14-6105]MCC0722788.1 nitroreductase family protein [Clostridioides sp. ZZV14-6104]MCC0729082.1 nitroreductase family protein [Clostridioides sp. ZZV14-6048]MCC0737506.1 nitroreductase family protein [Clostridioides sp. 
MNYKTIILNRKSVREYKKTDIKEEYLSEIKKYSESCKKLVPEIEVDIRVMNRSEVFDNLDKIAGYKGNMIDAPSYIIILSEVKDNYIENSGYIGENIIFKVTDLGIGSCWVTFEDSKKVLDKLGIDSDKEVTGIIAIGYGENASNTKVLNATKTGENYSKSDMQVVSDNSSSRLGVEEVVYMDEWGNNANTNILEERALLDAFHYARLAPSTLNRQPWRFIVDGGVVVLAVRKDGHTNLYEEKIDIGIVMLYFATIISATMFELKWNLGTPDKDYKIPEEYKIVGYCNI